jgi:pimeloyl-ACP methyl ester carboxylesterase
MTPPRIHRSVSADGTDLAATVHGEGPPVVFLPAGPGDSQLSWGHVVPWLREHCTCYLLETRGRGASGDHADHFPDRLVEDVLACAGSIAEPVAVVGWGSALWARVAENDAAPLCAVVAYEPGAGEVMSRDSAQRMGAVFGGVGALAAEGRLAEAARAFIDGSDVIYSEEDLASGAPAAFWEAAAERLPLFLLEQRQAAASGSPGPTSPAMLEKITVPMLLLHGDRSSRWFTESVRHVATHVADATVRTIPGAAHFGPHTHPRAVADEMIRFLAATHAATGSPSASVDQPG